MSKSPFPSFCLNVWDREYQQILRAQTVLSSTFLHDKNTWVTWEQTRYDLIYCI